MPSHPGRPKRQSAEYRHRVNAVVVGRPEGVYPGCWVLLNDKDKADYDANKLDPHGNASRACADWISPSKRLPLHLNGDKAPVVYLTRAAQLVPKAKVGAGAKAAERAKHEAPAAEPNPYVELPLSVVVANVAAKREAPDRSAKAAVESVALALETPRVATARAKAKLYMSGFTPAAGRPHCGVTLHSSRAKAIEAADDLRGAILPESGGCAFAKQIDPITREPIGAPLYHWQDEGGPDDNAESGEIDRESHAK